MLKQIRGYKIKEEMGSGAYGAVYRAYQPGMDRDVAVKVIRPEHASRPEFVQRFEAEAHLVTRLEHPHIVPVYDYWRDESGAYLVMRLLRGGSLKDKLREGSLTIANMARLVDDICGGLAAAHEKGVIHRDLKPSNILFDESGNAYLTDFGIAKNLEAEVKLTQTGAVLGTPDYISPEQIRGELLTAAADQYSLGIVLYQALTGRVPFPDESIATLFHKHLSEPLPPITTLRPELPSPVEAVLQTATAKQPDKRYPDVLSLARALKKALEGGPRPVAGILARTRSKLPVQATPFVGREHEVAEVQDLLETARLVTLTGPGGTGKTRLGLQVAEIAEASAEKYVDGVTFVGLASTTNPELVPNTIAHELGVVEQPNQSVDKILERYFRDKQALLVLDNFEHVLEQASLVSNLSAAAPNLTILSTSREALRLSGEHEYPVPPLSVPDPEQGGSVAEVSDYESIALFVQRAQAAWRSFRLTEENAPAVSAICARLDGLPLAIELAAARVKLFGPQGLLDRLESRLGLLKGGARDLPARQRTLRDTIDWSYNLLDGDEGQLFARLAAFTGGRSLEAVEAVCGPGLNIDALDGLESLINKSLLYQESGPNDEPRFIMLETIQEYARERLAENGEAQEIRDRHLQYFLSLAEGMEPGYRRHGQLLLLERTEADLGNIRAALEWAMENGKVKEAARMISSIDYFLYYKDRQVEGYRWFKRVLARSEAIPQVHQPRILLGAGRLAWVNSEASQSRNFFEKGLTLAQEMGDRRNEGWLLINLSTSLIDQPEEHEAAIRLCREGLMILREIDEKPGIAQGLNMLGELARATGDYARAGQMYEECIAVSQETGETFRQVMGLGNLAFVATHEEDYDRARNLLFSAIQRWRELGSWHGMTTGMAYLAGPLAGLGEPEKAARLLGASDALLAARGFDINLSDQHEYAKYVAEVKFQLDETTFEAAYAEGKAMTLEQAVAYALDDERY